MRICTKKNCRRRNRPQPESEFIGPDGQVFKTCNDCLERAKKYRAGHKCQLCGKRAGLHVHHNSYARVGREEPSDLIVLCARCHRWVHILIWPKFWWAKAGWWIIGKVRG